MDHCKDSENVIMHSILCVKLEPFEEDEDCTQNLDPLQLNSKVTTQVEILQDFKTEIETDCSDQEMNELIQDNILMNEPDEHKIEEINIKSEYFDNEAGLDDVLDSHRIIEDNSSEHNQFSEKNNSTNTGEKYTTRYELSHSCEPQCSDVINEESTNDGSSLNVTSAANPRAKSVTCSCAVDVLGIHKHSTSEEGGSKQSSSLIARSLLHTLYVCDVCDMTFKNSRNFIKHKVVHQKPHICDVCKKGFGQSSDLVRHKRIHTGEKPFVCNICKKGFINSSHLVGHTRTHTGQKPFVCEICKKGFKYSCDLVKHIRIHTGEKPFVCDICKKEFRQSSDLIIHKRIHTGEKPYVCNICKKGFIDSSHLVRHTRTHTGEKPNICNICKKGFGRSSDLVRHKRIHTDEQPYVCYICKNGFIFSSAVAKHKQIYAGQKPYVCDICKTG